MRLVARPAFVLMASYVMAVSVAAAEYRALGPSGSGNAGPLAFSPDGEWFAAVLSGSSAVGPRIDLWHVATRRKEATFRCPAGKSPSCVCFAADSRALAAGTTTGTGGIWMWCGEGETGWSEAKGARWWSPPTRESGAERRKRKGASAGSSQIGGIAFSSDGRTVAWSYGNEVYVARADAPEEAAVLETGGCTNSIAFSRDGSMLVLANTGPPGRKRGPEIQFWNPRTLVKRNVFSMESFGAPSLALAPNGKFAALAAVAVKEPSVTEGGVTGPRVEIRVWDVETGQSVLIWRSARPRSWLAFSPDSRTLAIPMAQPAEVLLWDVASGTAKARLLQPKGSEVSCTSYSPDGRFLATGLWLCDEPVGLWKLDEPKSSGILDVNR